jgi:predicted ABC-class ATPase
LLSSTRLADALGRIDGRGYKAYRDLEGAWSFGEFDLHVDHVQSDPFASPSKLRVRVPRSIAQIADDLLKSRTRRIASASFLARRIHGAIGKVAPRRSGTGKGGLVSIDAGGQEVLERTSVVFGEDFVEARLELGLPAAGRRVLGSEAARLLLEDLPEIVRRAWIDRDEEVDCAFRRFVDCVENQEAVRAQLEARGLIAFVGDGARLPRESGASEKPMPLESTQVFESPEAFRVEFEVPRADAGAPGTTWCGMGIPRGVVLLVGGGYHGKSTLLRAIEHGVVAHVLGDGRETVVSDPTLVKIRAEDGRAVTRVDIHGFIDHLPKVPGQSAARDPRSFSTPDASGSTSQAANIVEALEVGTRGLLLDEDTSATNFMLRDARMKALVHPRDEPITPFLERVREIYDELGVSTLLVMGGSGEFFRVADVVLELKNYQPIDVTSRAHALADSGPESKLDRAHAIDEVERAPFVAPAPRVPLASSFDGRRGRRDLHLASRGLDQIVFGTTEIDLRGIDQLFDPSQTRAIVSAIAVAAARYVDVDRHLGQILDDLERLFDDEGLDGLDPHTLRESGGCPRSERHPGAFARPRRFEIAAAINRMRTLRVETSVLRTESRGHSEG